jgi:hypothetical protein
MKYLFASLLLALSVGAQAKGKYSFKPPYAGAKPHHYSRETGKAIYLTEEAELEREEELDEVYEKDTSASRPAAARSKRTKHSVEKTETSEIPDEDSASGAVNTIGVRLGINFSNALGYGASSSSSRGIALYQVHQRGLFGLRSEVSYFRHHYEYAYSSYLGSSSSVHNTDEFAVPVMLNIEIPIWDYSTKPNFFLGPSVNALRENFAEETNSSFYGSDSSSGAGQVEMNIGFVSGFAVNVPLGRFDVALDIRYTSLFQAFGGFGRYGIGVNLGFW